VFTIKFYKTHARETANAVAIVAGNNYPTVLFGDTANFLLTRTPGEILSGRADTTGMLNRCDSIWATRLKRFDFVMPAVRWR